MNLKKLKIVELLNLAVLPNLDIGSSASCTIGFSCLLVASWLTVSLMGNRLLFKQQVVEAGKEIVNIQEVAMGQRPIETILPGRQALELSTALENLTPLAYASGGNGVRGISLLELAQDMSIMSPVPAHMPIMYGNLSVHYLNTAAVHCDRMQTISFAEWLMGHVWLQESVLVLGLGIAHLIMQGYYKLSYGPSAITIFKKPLVYRGFGL
jgi:hypothetical protein